MTLRDIITKDYHLDVPIAGHCPIVTMLMCYRANHIINRQNDIVAFFDSFLRHIPEEEHNKFEFIIKLDSDDEYGLNQLITKEGDLGLQETFPTLRIRFIIYPRWSGRATLYLNYMTMFSKRNPSSQCVGFATGDSIITRNFLPELEACLQSREKDYFIFSSQLDRERLEYAHRWRVVDWWAKGGLTEPFPIVSCRLLEVIGSMGWQSNIDNWLSLINVICWHRYGFMLYKKTHVPYIEINPIPQTMIEDNYPDKFNTDMYTSISKLPENSYYFNLVEQSALNIYLNMKAEKIL